MNERKAYVFCVCITWLQVVRSAALLNDRHRARAEVKLAEREREREREKG